MLGKQWRTMTSRHVAQKLSHNPLVGGSSPSRPTTFIVIVSRPTSSARTHECRGIGCSKVLPCPATGHCFAISISVAVLWSGVQVPHGLPLSLLSFPDLRPLLGLTNAEDSAAAKRCSVFLENRLCPLHSWHGKS
jgi:hypothetical protein